MSDIWYYVYDDICNMNVQLYGDIINNRIFIHTESVNYDIIVFCEVIIMFICGLYIV